MPFAKRSCYDWKLRTQSLPLGKRTLVMGILNATPDSFSDGGAFATHAGAIEHALAMLEDGADIVDIGGESTRPGKRQPLGIQEEIVSSLCWRVYFAIGRSPFSPSIPINPRPPGPPSEPASKS
jgi:hypothetical protein